ncbi:MAG TPA: DUF4129 domain-containing protein [Actinomycetota bacterium]|nr:DUF4129 domain-containing protein [Actinomycetota bacterium]
MRRVAALSSSLLLGVLVLGIAGRASAQTAIPAEDLRERLASAEALAEAGVEDPSSARMTQIRDALGLPVAVRIQGWTTSIGADPILEGLAGDDAGDFRRAGVRLRALRGALDGAIGARPLDPDDVESALDAAYRGSIQVDPGLVERIRRAVAEFIQGLFSRLFAFRGAGSVIAWAVIVGLGLLALWLLRRLRLVPETSMEVVGASAGNERVDWIAKAEEAFRAGDLRDAVHAFYRGLLTSLSGRGLLMDVPGLTAGECRSTVRVIRPDLFEAVSNATGTFERVAYGGVAPGPDEVETMRTAVTLARSA